MLYIKKIIFYCIFFLLFFISPKNIYADSFDSHDSYMLIPQIDDGKNKFTFDVQYDSNAFGKTLEAKADVNWAAYLNTNSIIPSSKDLDLTVSIDENNQISANSGLNVESGMEKNGVNKVLTFSFPAKKNRDAGLFLNKGTNAGDQQRAFEIGETLSNNLNSMLTAMDSLDGVKNLKNIIDLYNGVNEIRPDINSVGDFVTKDVLNVTIYYGTSLDGNLNGVPQGNPKTGELYAYIIPQGKELDLYSSKFTWAMLKGYLFPDGSCPSQWDASTQRIIIAGKSGQTYIDGLSDTKLNGGNPADDAVWISIFNMADVAVYSAYGPMPENILWKTITLVAKARGNEIGAAASWIENLISSIVRTFFLGIKSILGLESIHDLVYNGGARGSSSYESGMMNNNWWGIMLKYHIIFQIIAWMSIGLAISKVLVDLNYSTINPRTRVFIMEILQKFFVIGFLLVLCIPIIKLLASLNNYIVSIFQTQAQSESEMLSVGIGGIGGTLASIFVYASYFGILTVLNCTYIMRSIFIAILAASAPLFIVSMAFSKGQGLFTVWFKEISANIFLQSVHAFCLAFLFEIIDNGKFIEVLVVYFSLLPITEMFRGLIFGQAGGLAVSQGRNLGAQMASTVKEIGKQGVDSTLNTAASRTQKANGFNLDGESLSGSNGGGRQGKQEPSGFQNLSQTFADKAKVLQNNGDSAGFSKMSNIGKAIGATGNLMSSFDSMGEMAFQSNIGNNQGAMQAGKQLAQNIGQGVGVGANATMQGAGELNSYIKGGYAQAHNQGRQSLNAGEGLFKNAKNYLEGVNNYRKDGNSLFDSREANLNYNRYKSYSQGLSENLNSDTLQGIAKHVQPNGDICYKVNSDFINPSSGTLSDNTIESLSKGKDEYKEFAENFKNVSFNKTRDGNYMFNVSDTNRRINQKQLTNPINSNPMNIDKGIKESQSESFNKEKTPN